MVVEGVDVRTAQHRLGHSDPRLLLEIYAHVSSAADRDAAERLGARFLDLENTAVLRKDTAP
jgi:integrase